MLDVAELTEYLTIADGDELADVDEVVRVWAKEQMGYTLSLGYPRRDSTCRDAVSSVQWETTEEVNEGRLRSLYVRACEGAMEDLRDPYERAVIWQTYANAVGPAVWRSGPLRGRSKEQLRALLRRALSNLRPLLRKRGVNV